VAGEFERVSEGVLAHELKAAIILFFSLLDERQRRFFAGLESLKIGLGKIRPVCTEKSSLNQWAKFESCSVPAGGKKSPAACRLSSNERSGFVARVEADLDILVGNRISDDLDSTRIQPRMSLQVALACSCGSEMKAPGDSAQLEHLPPGERAG
jgi:hypothetical protein